MSRVQRAVTRNEFRPMLAEFDSFILFLWAGLGVVVFIVIGVLL